LNSGKALKEAKSGSFKTVPNLRLYSPKAVRRQSAAFFPSRLPQKRKKEKKKRSNAEIASCLKSHGSQRKIQVSIKTQTRTTFILQIKDTLKLRCDQLN